MLPFERTILLAPAARAPGAATCMLGPPLFKFYAAGRGAVGRRGDGPIKIGTPREARRGPRVARGQGTAPPAQKRPLSFTGRGRDTPRT